MTWSGSILVGCGSAFGTLSRYAISQTVSKVNSSEFPWGTWITNMLGTLLLGLFFQEFCVLHHHPNWWLLLGTGFCGAFTTFSTMSVESIQLFRQRFFLGILYLGSSLSVGFLLASMTKWLI